MSSASSADAGTHELASGGRCAICSGATKPEAELFDDRYGFPGRHVLQRCGSCGHRMLDARMDADQIANLYTRYYPRSSFDIEAWQTPEAVSDFLTWWRGLKASAFRWVPPNVRVLDIGCGFGESLGYHRARGCDAQPPPTHSVQRSIRVCCAGCRIARVAA